MTLSEDVWQLVRTVERLPREDQDKILQMVDLLALVPLPVQRRAQRMLRDLLAHEPENRDACVAGLDEVIGYLERSAASSGERALLARRIEFAKLKAS
jgi:hypothetical protein